MSPIVEEPPLGADERAHPVRGRGVDDALRIAGGPRPLALGVDDHVSGVRSPGQTRLPVRLRVEVDEVGHPADRIHPRLQSAQRRPRLDVDRASARLRGEFDELGRLIERSEQRGRVRVDEPDRALSPCASHLLEEVDGGLRQRTGPVDLTDHHRHDRERRERIDLVRRRREGEDLRHKVIEHAGDGDGIGDDDGLEHRQGVQEHEDRSGGDHPRRAGSLTSSGVSGPRAMIALASATTAGGWS